MSDLYPPKEDRQVEMPKRRIAETYSYLDEQRKLLYQTVRWEPKNFSQRVFVGPDLSRDGWRWSLGDVRRVLYGLPDLLADPRQPVLIVEGERKVDHLRELDLVATCNVGGSQSTLGEGGKWLDSYSETLRGRRVAILPDNDAPGWRHAYFVAGSLVAHGVASLRIVQLPDLPPKGDVVNWLAGGGTREELCRLVRQTPEWQSHLIG